MARAPAAPAGRWTGYFVDLRFPGPKNAQGKEKQFRFTTSVGITPNTFPYPVGRASRLFAAVCTVLAL